MVDIIALSEVALWKKGAPHRSWTLTQDMNDSFVLMLSDLDTEVWQGVGYTIAEAWLQIQYTRRDINLLRQAQSA